jgi:hypothetical protein
LSGEQRFEPGAIRQFLTPDPRTLNPDSEPSAFQGDRVISEIANQLDLESAVAALLDELSNVQSDLLAALVEKREALAAADLPRLAALQPQEEQLAERLARCLEERARLLSAAQAEGLPHENVAKLATGLKRGKAGSLGEQVKQAQGRMQLLAQQCLTNWVLAQRSLLHVSQLLEIIATGGRLQPTYGDKESVHARGTLVNQQA